MPCALPPFTCTIAHCCNRQNCANSSVDQANALWWIRATAHSLNPMPTVIGLIPKRHRLQQGCQFSCMCTTTMHSALAELQAARCKRSGLVLFFISNTGRTRPVRLIWVVSSCDCKYWPSVWKLKYPVAPPTAGVVGAHTTGDELGAIVVLGPPRVIACPYRLALLPTSASMSANNTNFGLPTSGAPSLLNIMNPLARSALSFLYPT